MNIAVWIFGACGIISNFLIYTQNERRKMLFNKLVADCFWTLHYFMLGAWSGGAVCAVGILRESVFINSDKKWAKGKKWLIVFLVLSACGTALTWKNWFCILPALASAISVFSFWKGNPCLTKKLAFPISVSFLTYDIYCRSYTGTVNELFVLTSVFISGIKKRC